MILVSQLNKFGLLNVSPLVTEEFDDEKAEEEYAKLIAEQKIKREEEEEKKTMDKFQNRFKKTSLFGNLKKKREAKKAADAKKNVRATM